jgi:putative hydrolase of the HAD superfamily
MKKPKMILFDFGHTLICESSFNGVRGTEAVLKYAVRNENNLSAQEVSRFSSKIFEEMGRMARDHGAEVHNHMTQRLVYEYLQIDIPLLPEEMEQIFWDNAAPAIPMPNIHQVLDYLYKQGIRTGVISNIAFSGSSVKKKINSLLPNNHFEFIIASSEYAIRKPNPMIFELALRKANLAAGEVWYCGDNTKFDVYGASAVGIFPVWFHSPLECDYRDKSLDIKPNCEHLYINDWLELIAVLESL